MKSLILCFVLTTGSWANSRIANRRSTFCASLLTAARRMGGTNPADVRDAFDRFSRASVITKATERAARRAQSDRGRLVTLSIEGEAQIEAFFRAFAQARKDYVREADQDFGPTATILMGIQYYGGMLAAPLFAMNYRLLQRTAELVWTSPEYARIFAPYVIITAAMGGYDYPVGFVRSFNFSYQNLRRKFAAFREGEAPWFYWRRDFRVSREFLTTLKAKRRVNWYADLHRQNQLEEAPGLLYLLVRKGGAGEQAVKLSVDLLIERRPAGPRLSLIVSGEE